MNFYKKINYKLYFEKKKLNEKNICIYKFLNIIMIGMKKKEKIFF
jgi:hypothetical protein